MSAIMLQFSLQTTTDQLKENQDNIYFKQVS